MKNFHVKIGVLLLSTLIFFSSNREKQPAKKMNEFRTHEFYTTEGKKYNLRVVTQRGSLTASGNDIIFITRINNTYDAGIGGGVEFYYLDAKTEKKIIPIMAYLSFANITVNQIEIASCYYGMTRGKGPPFTNMVGTFEYAKSITKMLPLITAMQYTSTRNYKYALKYTDAVLSETDFMNMQTGAWLYWGGNLNTALNDATVLADLRMLCPADDYVVGATFIYFELE